MDNKKLIKMYLAIAGLFAIAEIILLITGNANSPISGVLLFILFFTLSFGAKKSVKLKGLAFTLQIFAFVSFTLYFPQLFTKSTWGMDTNILIVPSIQVIMFGMGTKLSISDFVKELSKPFKVIIGTLMVYVLMPVAAMIIINVYKFPPEAAAGIILLGVCPGGAASNVMTYLAKGNLALSMTVTTLTTLLSPVLTPLLMQLLAGHLIVVDSVKMMLDIVNIIIVPVFAGIIINKLLYGNVSWMKKEMNVGFLGLMTFLTGLGLFFLKFPSIIKSMQIGFILVLWAVTIVSITVIFIRRKNGPSNWMDFVLPKLSLTAIMLYIVLAAANRRDALISIGPAILLAAMAHNILGYIFTILSSRALRFNDADTRALTMEVGTKNAGLALGLATNALQSAAAALAPLFFGVWMNISASFLASFWSQREPKVREPRVKKIKS
jgi:bile acid:Na+ symporter, BASS family